MDMGSNRWTKGTGLLVIGVFLLAFGAWIGFIGYSEGTEERGLYVYEKIVTYPWLGVILILGGLVQGGRGALVLAGREAKREAEKAALTEKYS